MSDPHDLQRFVDAQQPVFDQVRAELQAGRKRTHWMWFVFPQIAGLGHSAMAQHYAISSRAEAEAYLAHPVLGARLRELTRIVNGLQDRSAAQIFGYPDDMKFHSSMTLFARCEGEGKEFDQALGSTSAAMPIPRRSTACRRRADGTCAACMPCVRPAPAPGHGPPLQAARSHRLARTFSRAVARPCMISGAATSPSRRARRVRARDRASPDSALP